MADSRKGNGFARGTKVTLTVSIFFLIWGYLLFINQSEGLLKYKPIITALPGYLVLVFGCYALISIGSDLSKLQDFPEESELLKTEIEESKKFYEKKNVKL